VYPVNNGSSEKIFRAECNPNFESLHCIADLMIVTAPIGLGLGRIGNFINGELYGRVTGVPWGMIFAKGGPLPRHPSQLYESALEGEFSFGSSGS